MGSKFDYARTSVADGVGWFEFDRPPVNAMHWEMLREFEPALGGVLADPTARVIVIASALEKYFSVGADLAVFDGIGADGMGEWVRLPHGLVRRMRASKKRLLAAIHGTAVGGGLEIT